MQESTQPKKSVDDNQQQLTSMQKKVQKLMADWYTVQVTSKFEVYQVESSKKGGKGEEIDEAKLKQRVFVTPIEDLGIEQTAMDEHVINNKLKKPLLIEIKELRNVSQPFQRGLEKSTKDDPEKEKKRIRKLKNQTYQLKAHDGKRLIKIIMLFQDQDQFVRGLHEVNKYCLYDANLAPADPNTFVLDYPEQIVPLYVDKYSPRLTEEYQMLQGLPIKYTSAPRFVFLNENAGEAGFQQEKEKEDEFADLFHQFDVPDLTSSERTFVKRFEQLGFWRKKFNQQATEFAIKEESKDKK